MARPDQPGSDKDQTDMTTADANGTMMPLDEARDCPRCHHEIVLGRDGAPVCSSYATNWCGRELLPGRDDARLETLEVAARIGALRRVEF